MAYAHIETGLFARLQNAFDKIVREFREDRARRATFERAFAELQMLNQRELMEFGLHRSDLVELARVEASRL